MSNGLYLASDWVRSVKGDREYLRSCKDLLAVALAFDLNSYLRPSVPLGHGLWDICLRQDHNPM